MLLMIRRGGGESLVTSDGMVFLLHSRPLPCWVRSHGRSTILNKILFLVLSGGDRTGDFYVIPPGSPPLLLFLRPCSLSVFVHWFAFSISEWRKLLHRNYTTLNNLRYQFAINMYAKSRYQFAINMYAKPSRYNFAYSLYSIKLLIQR
ncbi:hypothetical protein M6B38_142100 [Iris pallida]|uniref:Uncharacterized protein n=1 Tax=Iris pallida TaxID=29817 RepID=A0AAX6FBK8_IRIPA|nr:hypothetical protein M6B38_142100 [Iris pallida]